MLIKADSNSRQLARHGLARTAKLSMMPAQHQAGPRAGPGAAHVDHHGTARRVGFAPLEAAPVAELVDAPDSKSGIQKMCWFESGLGHQIDDKHISI